DDRVVGRDEQRIGGDPIEIDGRCRQRSSPCVARIGGSSAGILPPGSGTVTPLGRAGSGYGGCRRQNAGGSVLLAAHRRGAAPPRPPPPAPRGARGPPAP